MLRQQEREQLSALTIVEIEAHRYEMREAYEDGLISQSEYEGQMNLMDEAEQAICHAEVTKNVISRVVGSVRDGRSGF